MKYVISINQLTWQAICPEATIRHAAVLDAIKGICNSVSDNMIRSNDGYTWIAYDLILSELPLLKIRTKAGLTPIIKDLQEWALIDIKKDTITGYYYFKLTSKSESLDRLLNSEEIKQVLDFVNDPVSKSKRPRLQKLTYQDTNINNTIINNNSGEITEKKIGMSKEDAHPDASILTDEWIIYLKEGNERVYEQMTKDSPEDYENSCREHFHKMITLDKYPLEDIQKVLKELFQGRFYRFWIQGANMMTPGKFRQRMKRKQGEPKDLKKPKYYEWFKLKMPDVFTGTYYER